MADEESSDFGDEGEDNPWEDQMKEAVEEKQNEVANSSLENPTDALFEDFEEDEGPAVPVRDLVDFAKKGRELKERRQAAFGFAHFSTDPESQEAIVNYKNDYGTEALMSLLSSGDPICTRYAALSLGNLVSNPDFSPHLIEFGVLQALLPKALDSKTDLETRRYSCLAVANMATQKQTHKVLVMKLGSLIEMITDHDEEIQKCACLTMQNLCTNRAILSKLTGIITPLTEVIKATRGTYIPHPDAKMHAVAALAGLAVTDQLRMEILKQNVLVAFVEIIDAPPCEKILPWIAGVYSSLAQSYQTHIDLLEAPVLNSIFFLAVSNIIEAQRHAATCIANLASNAANHDTLIYGCNCISNLITMCDFQDMRVKSACARALANFAADPKLHQKLLDEGSLLCVSRILLEADEDCHLFGSLYFAIMSDNMNIHPLLYEEDLIKALFHLAVDQAKSIQTKRYAILTLANISVSGASHDHIRKEIDMQPNPFFLLASASDEETCRYLALLLSNLANNPENVSMLTPVLHKCLPLVRTKSSEVMNNVLSFLLKIMTTEEVRVTIAKLYVSEITAMAHQWKTEEFQFMVSAFYATVAASEKARLLTNWGEVVKIWKLLLRSGHQDIMLQTLSAIGATRDVEFVTEYICREESEMLPDIFKALQSPSIEIQAQAIKVLTGIAGYECSVAALTKSRFVEIVGPMIRSPHPLFRKYAFTALANFAGHREGLVDLHDVNLVKCVQYLNIDEQVDIEEMRVCLHAVANSSNHKNNVSRIADSGMLVSNIILDFVKRGDEIIYEKAALFFDICSNNLHNHPMFGQREILELLMELAIEGNGVTALRCVNCLRKLAHEGQWMEMLLKCGLIDFCVKFCKMRRKKEYSSYSVPIDREFTSMIYCLTMHDSFLEAVQGTEFLQYVCDTIESEDLMTRREICRAITNISQSPITRKLFLKKENLDGLLTALKVVDMDVFHSVAIAFGYIFSTDEVQEGTTEVVNRNRILSLLQQNNRQLQISALWATSGGQECIIQSDPVVLKRIAELAEIQMPGTDVPIDQNGEVMDIKNPDVQRLIEKFGETPRILQMIRRRALVTLANYATHKKNHRLILDNCSNIVDTVFNLGDCHDPMVLQRSALFLSNLSYSVELHSSFSNAVDVSRLDLLVGSEDKWTQIYSVSALRQLVITEKYAKQAILCERLVPLCCLAALRAPVELVREIMGLFRNLARHKKYVPFVLAQHVIPCIMQVFEYEDTEVLEQALQALQNFGTSQETLMRILEYQEGAPIMWRLAQHHHTPISFGAVQLLADIAVLQPDESKYHLLAGLRHQEDRSDRLSAEDKVKGLLKVILHSGGDHEYYASVIGRELCGFPEMKEKLIEFGFMTGLFKLLKSERGTTQEMAIAALGELLALDSGMKLLLEIDGYETKGKIDTIALLQYGMRASTTVQCQQLSLACVCKILDYSMDRTGQGQHRGDHHHRFFMLPEDPSKPDGFTLLQLIGKTPHQDLQIYVALLLAMMSTYQPYIEKLNSKETTRLISFLGDRAKQYDKDFREHHEGKKSKKIVGMHVSIATIINNMCLNLPSESFALNASGMMPLVNEHLDDEHPLIKSLAFCSLSNPTKGTQCSALFECKPNAMLMLEELSQTKSPECLFNVAQTMVNVTKLEGNIKYMFSEEHDIIKILAVTATCSRLAVRRLALVSMQYVTNDERWKQRKVHKHIFEVVSILQDLLGKWTAGNDGSTGGQLAQAIEILLLQIVNNMSVVPQFRSVLISGFDATYEDEAVTSEVPTVVATLVKIVKFGHDKAIQRRMTIATLVNLCSHSTNLVGLLDQCVLEALLMVAAEQVNEGPEFKTASHLTLISMKAICNLATIPHERVVNGRETRLNERAMNLIKAQQKSDGGKLIETDPTPFLDFECQRAIFERIPYFQGAQRNQLRLCCALLASRVTSHREWMLQTMDLCYLDSIMKGLTDRVFDTQTCMLLTFCNFVLRASTNQLEKIIGFRNWPSCLLCFIDAKDTGVRCVAYQALDKLIGDGSGASRLSPAPPSPNRKRILSNFVKDKQFPDIVRKAFHEDNPKSVRALASIYRSVCSDLGFALLREYAMLILQSLIHYILSDDPLVHTHAAFAVAAFMPHAETVKDMLLEIKDSYRALFKILDGAVGEEIVSFAGSPPDVALNVYVLAAFAGTTHKREISRAIVKQNGLKLITNQILNGPANPSKLKQFQMQNVEVSPAMYGAQILRNVSRDIRNMKAMLSCGALRCIAKSVKCSNMEMKYLGIGSFAEVISHVTTKKVKDMYRFTIDHLGEEMATIVDALLHVLTSGEVEGSEVDDELTDIPGADVTTELKNDEKLVKIACNLLYIIARDNEDAKRLIAQSGLLATLCENCIDYLESGVSIGETLLGLLKLIACNHITQTAFVEDGLSKLVRYLVEADRPETHNHATCVFHSLANNLASHPTVVKNGLLPLLLVLRNSKDLDSRRVSLESLLNFVENSAIHHLIRDEYDLVQTIVAISKFGINKNVKERAADAILELMGDGKLPSHLKKLKIERTQKAQSPQKQKKVPPLALPAKKADESDEIPTKESKPPSSKPPSSKPPISSKEPKLFSKETQIPSQKRKIPSKAHNIPKLPLRKDFPAAPSTPDLDAPAVPSTPDCDSPAVPSTPDVAVKAPPITVTQITTLSEADQPIDTPIAQTPSIPQEIEDKQSTTQTQENLTQPPPIQPDLSQTHDLEDKSIVEKKILMTEP